MKFFVVLTIIATCVLAIDGAAIDRDIVKTIDEPPVVLPQDISEDCNQPKVMGRCYALFYRYAFNVEKRACERFIYGGCGGNTNNFESKAECERKCIAKKVEDTSTTEIQSTAQTFNDKTETSNDSSTEIQPTDQTSNDKAETSSASSTEIQSTDQTSNDKAETSSASSTEIQSTAQTSTNKSEIPNAKAETSTDKAETSTDKAETSTDKAETSTDTAETPNDYAEKKNL